jgi:hypothetical protein
VGTDGHVVAKRKDLAVTGHREVVPCLKQPHVPRCVSEGLGWVRKARRSVGVVEDDPCRCFAGLVL